MRPNLAPQEIDKPLDTVFLKDAEAVHVIETVGNTRRLKERHCLHVLHHAVVRFRQKGDVDRMMPGGGMIEAELVSEDRLARSRLAPHNVNASFEKAPSQNGVEARDAGGHALEGRLPGGIDWIGSHGVPYVDESGRVTVKVDPSAGRLVTSTSPCIASTRWRTTQRPMPKPPCSRRVTARSKAPKMRAWASSEMPIP